MTLKELRLMAGLTQEKAAFKIDVAVRTYVRWEHEEGAIPTKAIPILAKVFKVSQTKILETINSSKKSPLIKGL